MLRLPVGLSQRSAAVAAKTFDEFELSGEQYGERRCFLKENEDYKILLLEGKLLDIVFPPDVPLKVVETAPPIRGGFDSTWKEATLETGIHIQVPLFVAKGETIRVDTLTRKYAGRHA